MSNWPEQEDVAKTENLWENNLTCRKQNLQRYET